MGERGPAGEAVLFFAPAFFDGGVCFSAVGLACPLCLVDRGTAACRRSLPGAFEPVLGKAEETGGSASVMGVLL
jgi:hypothetical protein